MAALPKDERHATLRAPWTARFQAMPDIHIHRKHTLGLAKARKVAWALGRAGARRSSTWSAPCSRATRATRCEFTRSGVNGQLIVAADHFDLNAKLGLLLGAFAKTIEAEIEKNLDGLLGKAQRGRGEEGRARRRSSRRRKRQAGRRGYFSDSIRSTYSCIASSALLPLSAVPRVPLGAAHHVGEPGALALHIAAVGLLVQRVDLQQRGVVGFLGQALAVGNGLLEVGFQVGHVKCFLWMLGGGWLLDAVFSK